MIGQLKGIIDSIGDDYLILDVGGVGYLVFASPRTLAQCEQGAAMTLQIETHVREDHIHLYGFMSEAERSGFRLLTTVQGVGVRMALAIQGQFTGEQLYTVIAAQDKKALTVVSGVGPKLAERIITELKSKVTQFAAGGFAVNQATPVAAAAALAKGDGAGVMDDAVSALVNLGYGRSEAYMAVAHVRTQGTDGLDALIKAGLKELAG